MILSLIGSCFFQYLTTKVAFRIFINLQTGKLRCGNAIVLVPFPTGNRRLIEYTTMIFCKQHLFIEIILSFYTRKKIATSQSSNTASCFQKYFILNASLRKNQILRLSTGNVKKRQMQKSIAHQNRTHESIDSTSNQAEKQRATPTEPYPRQHPQGHTHAGSQIKANCN